MQCWQGRGHGALSWGSLPVPNVRQPYAASFARPTQPFGVHGRQQRQLFLGSKLDPINTCTGISPQAHRTAVSLQQRPPSSTDHGNHPSSHQHPQHRQLKDDGSVKIIMLLSLSLTLLLLPWMSRHPEFLIAPLLLAVTPVVGNGVRPVLREVARGILATLRLMGMAAWYDVTHDLPPHHHNHHHQHSHNAAASQNGSSSSSSSSGGVHHAPAVAGSQQQQLYGREAAAKVYRQQQQQQQQPLPSGPYSPWPNPAYMPADWPPAAAAAAAAAVLQQEASPTLPPLHGAAAAGAPAGRAMSHPVSHPIPGDDADADWTASAPPDPHRGDPASLQHLQQVLAADLQTEAELGQQPTAASVAPLTAAAAGKSSSSNSRGPVRQGSPAGSPARGSSPSASVDALEFGQQQQQQQAAALSGAAATAGSLPGLQESQQRQQQQQQQQQVRDPRVLSKEAKQQLYQNHINHNHRHHQ